MKPKIYVFCCCYIVTANLMTDKILDFPIMLLNIIQHKIKHNWLFCNRLLFKFLKNIFNE